jgi:anti-sigma factor RsiW
MSDITDIERALSERLEEVGAHLAELERERGRLQRALRAIRDEPAPEVECAHAAQRHAPPWERDRTRR